MTDWTVPPLLRTFISPEEVFPGRVVTYGELSALATTINRTEGLKFLGFLNLLLSSAALEADLVGPEPARDVQAWLIGNVISRELLSVLQSKMRDASFLDRPFLHRTQVLFVARLVATHGQATGGNMLATRDARDLLGDLLFLTNGLFRVDEPPPKASIALWVATQVAPLYETENAPALALAWPRAQELLTRRLPAVADDPVELERLERVALFTSGFNVQAWFDLTFLLFSFWSTVTFRDLIAEPSRGCFDPHQPHEIVSKDVLSKFTEGLSVGLDELPEWLNIAEFSREILFDLTPFRAKPLWRLPDGAVMCVDVGLLMERLGPHVFWSMINALDTDDRRKRFTSIWGKAFEGSCLDTLQEVFASRRWSYARNPIDQATNEEVWDAVAVRGDVAIVIECKGTFVRSADKYSGEPGRFFKGLSKKFGRAKHGGVHQLLRGIFGVWLDRRVAGAFVQPDRVSEVFPVLVVQDPIIGCGPVARVLSDRFQAGLQKRVHIRRPRIWPLTILTADDLDKVASSKRITGARLDSILKSFHRSHPSRAVSFGDFLASSASAHFGFPDRVRADLRARWVATGELVLGRFRAKEYGGTKTGAQVSGPSPESP